MRITITPPGPPAPEGSVVHPPPSTLSGVYTSLLPLSASHSDSLFTNIAGPPNAHLWTFLQLYAPPDQSDFEASVSQWSVEPNRQFYAVVPADADGAAHGLVSYLNISPENRRLEIGSIVYGTSLQRTRAATETTFLLLRHAFDDLGYARVEWKANSLNTPSLTAAERMGFVPEGVFRKHIICKGKWRDTAWFSITEDEWPVVKKGFEVWLDASNFDDEGRQKRGLRECREAGK
ncbi:hypothetical protein ACO1O0_004728 [Amphichorda felina]